MLLRAGMAPRTLLLLNLLSALLSCLGAAAGAAVGQSAAHLTPWILTVTAGTFLYVALADMVRGQPGMGAAGPGHVPAPLSPRSAPSSPRCCGVLARAPGATSSCRTRGSCWAAASCWASPWPKATSVPGCSPDRGGFGPARPHPANWRNAAELAGP